MRRDLRERIMLFAGLVVAGCSSEPPVVATTEPSTPADAGVDAAVDPGTPPAEVVAARALAWLEGEFDSTEQAKADSAYFEISLRSCRVDVPSLGRNVMYVEQARVGASPYRQRLYVIDGVDASTARSRVLEPKAPAPLVGYCSAASRAPLRPEDFLDRVGCVVELHWTGDRFVGHTPDSRWTGDGFVADPAGQRCASSLNGASYATTSVTVERDRLVSWDRGFDERGKQVWGAPKGGYEFVRRSPLRDP